MGWGSVVVIMISSLPIMHAQDCAAGVKLLQRHAHLRPSVSQPSLDDKLKARLIPRQLLMTGRFDSFYDLPALAFANVNNTRAHAPDFTFFYLNDHDCHRYLEEHFPHMARFYIEERHGSFRGDICRSAVLLREGGFYADLDFDVYAPLLNLIDDNTTFMSVFAYRVGGQGDSTILNALIGVSPNSPIMQLTMSEIEKYYISPPKESSFEVLPGPTAMANAISELMKQTCPDVALRWNEKARGGRVACGTENMRFLEQVFLGSGQACARHGELICPKQRETSKFDGTQYGVFSIGNEDMDKRLIGWPRYLACSTPGCNIAGGVTARWS